MPPPIRYPLPTLMAILLLGLVAWRGGEWLRVLGQAVSTRWQRVVEGPPVPASTAPMVVAGPIIRKGLILRDGAPISVRPETKPFDTIGPRKFVDIYDVWPLKGTPSYFRVGNLGPIGWISAADCFAWDTRLVIRAPGGRLTLARSLDGPTVEVDVGLSPLPVTAWRGSWVEVAIWDIQQPWKVVASRGWLDLEKLPRSAVGVLLLSTVELPRLLTLAVEADDPGIRDSVRLRAILGRLVENVAWTASDVDTARKALPSRVFERTMGVNSSERIAGLNASNSVDAAWGGREFRFVPLDDLP
jgi:hypothetical protein